ncbi:MAG TPA: methyltransferase domain-containing protein [Aggregatilineales bacterium]|nr:methyltransferase domain-containing protein [Aggregatilineales bacterium]
MADQETIRRMIANEADMAYRRRVQTIFDWLDPQEGDRILDAGCGRGFYPRFIRAASSAEVVGLELEFDYVQIARRALAGLDGITLVNGSLYDPPFPDEYFDKVILSEVLEHVPDDVGALRALARVLKPGGLIAITVPNANYPFWWDPINKTLETLFGTHIQHGVLAGIWANHVRLYTHEELFRTVRRAGLELVEVRSFTHYCFPFIHNIVYGFGKTALEAGVLPGSIAKAADRHNITGDRGSPLNPVNIGLRVFEWFDRRNTMNEPPSRSTVNLCVLVRKPGG